MKNLAKKYFGHRIEHPVGSLLKYRGVTYEVVKDEKPFSDGCTEDCDLNSSDSIYCCPNPRCADYERKDKQNVVFKRKSKDG